MSYLLCDPSAKLNFSHDWSDHLASGSTGSPTDTIASRQWTIEPSGGSPSPTLTGDTSDIVFVEGLEVGKVYRLTEEVVTGTGVRDQRSIILRCDET